MLPFNKERNTDNMEIHAIDLFCGAGGLTRGLEDAGISVKLGVDSDPACKYAYEENNEAEFRGKKVEELEVKELESHYKNAKYTLLVGCPPCQPFSIINKHRSPDDTRWGLLEHFSEFVKKILPDFISVENVPPARHQEVFKKFIKDLKKLGYQVSDDIVNCADYGLPQRRRRLIILASKHGKIKLVPKEEYSDQKKTVRDVIGRLPPIEDGMADAKGDAHWSPKLSELNMARIKKSKPGKSWDIWPENLIAECHKKESGKHFKSAYGRMSWDEVAPTITTYFSGYNNGRFGHPRQNRTITFREGAMLQGFPEGYKFYDTDNPLTRTSLSRMIGNAVPVNLGKVIGESVKRHVEEIEDGREKV